MSFNVKPMSNLKDVISASAILLVDTVIKGFTSIYIYIPTPQKGAQELLYGESLGLAILKVVN